MRFDVEPCSTFHGLSFGFNFLGKVITNPRGITEPFRRYELNFRVKSRAEKSSACRVRSVLSCSLNLYIASLKHQISSITLSLRRCGSFEKLHLQIFLVQTIVVGAISSSESFRCPHCSHPHKTRTAIFDQLHRHCWKNNGDKLENNEKKAETR